ncbi:MAG: hypothetical protein ACUVTL_01175 [Thermoproteota archaeon]
MQGARPKYLILDITYPDETGSKWLQKTTRMLDAEAGRHGDKVLGWHT